MKTKNFKLIRKIFTTMCFITSTFAITNINTTNACEQSNLTFEQNLNKPSIEKILNSSAYTSRINLTYFTFLLDYTANYLDKDISENLPKNVDINEISKKFMEKKYIEKKPLELNGFDKPIVNQIRDILTNIIKESNISTEEKIKDKINECLSNKEFLNETLFPPLRESMKKALINQYNYTIK